MNARSRRPLVPVLALAAGVALSACAVPRQALGPGEAPCFTALPAAAGAVHHQGHLAGVRLVNVSAVGREPAPVAAAARADRARGARVCLIAFTGHFEASAVTSPRGAARGRTAVVVVTFPGLDVLGTVLLGGRPAGFGHPHIG